MWVYLLDDDSAHAAALARHLAASGYRSRAFTDADEFHAHACGTDPACAIVEAQAGGYSTLAVWDALRAKGICLPMIFLVAWPDIAVCVQAMRRGAVDFLTKPCQPAALHEALQRAEAQSASWHAARTRDALLHERLVRLTPREREVLALVLAGHRNKQIAALLCSQESTVKVHRSRLMHKLGARSLADLMRLREQIESAPVPVRSAAPGRAIPRSVERPQPWRDGVLADA
jgi:FixJ family two-component response regulator